MALRTQESIIVEQINTWSIRCLELIMPETEPPRMVVVLATGYYDGVEVAWKREQRIDIPAAALVAAWSQPAGDQSIYAAVKLSLYQWLQANGYIPADAEIIS